MPTQQIDWRHGGRQLILPVALMPDAGAHNALDSVRTDGLLDTGATSTGLRGDIADRLSLRPQGRRRVETANSPLWANEYVVRLGLIAGNYESAGFDPTSVYPFILERHLMVFELQRGFAYPVLLGMDVIAQCDLHVLRDGTASLLLGE